MATTPSTVVGDYGGVRITASELVETVVKLIPHFVRTSLENHRALYKLCLFLALFQKSPRYSDYGIDLAITNKEVPSSCSHIPLLLKQVYNYKKDSSLEAAFVVLMVSIKSACQVGWFSNKDADDLELLTKEAVKGFSNPEDVDIGPRCALPYLGNILSRCNPLMKTEKILVSLGVKRGFGAYVSNFNIAKDRVTSQHEKICFDLQSYMELNLKEPSWRCPICKVPAGGTDLHVDRRFLKVLRESPVLVNDVIISKRLWKPVSLRKDCLQNNIFSNISQITSLALVKVPVFSTGSSITNINVKPNNAPLNIEPTHVPLQHHSTDQPNAVQSDHLLPPEGSDSLKILKSDVIPTHDDGAKRMRGSFTGQAYDAALNRLMSLPIQPSQAPPRPTLLLRQPIVIPVHLPQP